jgi:hypothetical protein
MKQVNVYNVNKWIRESPSNDLNLEVHGTRGELAILEGPGGIIVSCCEGVFFVECTADATIPVPLCPAPEQDTEGNAKSFCLFPTHHADLPIKEIREGCECEEKPLGEFVRRFGHRLEANYRQLLKAIEEIGLDPADYPRGQEDFHEVRVAAEYKEMHDPEDLRDLMEIYGFTPDDAT